MGKHSKEFNKVSRKISQNMEKTPCGVILGKLYAVYE